MQVGGKFALAVVEPRSVVRVDVLQPDEDKWPLLNIFNVQIQSETNVRAN